MNFYLMVNVVMARKKYDIQYPALYAPAGHKYEKEFNSVQRAHQNTLEVSVHVSAHICQSPPLVCETLVVECIIGRKPEQI